MTKRLLSIFVLVAVVLFAGAQSRTNIYTARLSAPDVSTRATVVVSNDADVAGGLNTASINHVEGYRILIFFDNTQNGRNLANGALSLFRKQFPGIPSEVVYANPTFKTMAGYCVDKTEVAMLLGRVSEIFPNSVVVREDNMPISQLTHYNSSSTPSDSLLMSDTSIEF